MPSPQQPATDTDTDTQGDSVGGAPAGRPVGREGARVDIEERKAWYLDRILAFFLALALTAASVWMVVTAAIAGGR